ncbi:MAG: nitrous oxide reductase accessory protein NosL, partial [Burkholderiaceae bacterium]
VRKNPRLAAEKIEQWTKINKEVAYVFLGPSGIHTLDPTIKPRWIEALKADYAVLQKLNMIKELNIPAWVNDTYARQAFKEAGLNYDSQKMTLGGYSIKGTDPVCKAAITKPTEAGEIWIKDGEIVPLSSAACTLSGVKKYTQEGKKLSAVYLIDKALGIKVFADAAFYAVGGKDPAKPEIVPFLLKKDAEAFATKAGGKVATYAEALELVPSASR